MKLLYYFITILLIKFSAIASIAGQLPAALFLSWAAHFSAFLAILAGSDENYLLRCEIEALKEFS